VIFCWPERFEADMWPGASIEGGNGEQVLRCVGIVCGVTANAIAVHYFLPDGANGSCDFPIAAAVDRGRWWPRSG
jgi:hypothetical protein